MNHFQAHRLLLFVQQHIVARISRVQFSPPWTSKQSSPQNHDFGNFHEIPREQNCCLLLSVCEFPLIKMQVAFGQAEAAFRIFFVVSALVQSLRTMNRPYISAGSRSNIPCRGNGLYCSSRKRQRLGRQLFYSRHRTAAWFAVCPRLC